MLSFSASARRTRPPAAAVLGSALSFVFLPPPLCCRLLWRICVARCGGWGPLGLLLCVVFGIRGLYVCSVGFWGVVLVGALAEAFGRVCFFWVSVSVFVACWDWADEYIYIYICMCSLARSQCVVKMDVETRRKRVRLGVSAGAFIGVAFRGPAEHACGFRISGAMRGSGLGGSCLLQCVV